MNWANRLVIPKPALPKPKTTISVVRAWESPTCWQARTTETENNDFLLLQGNAGYVDGGDESCGGNGRGALNIVVEGAELVPVTAQEPGCIGTRKVFPLQQNVRPACFHCGDKGLHKVIVFLSSYTVVAPTYIEGVVEALLIVGADIEQDGKTVFRMDATERGVEGHLPDRDAHTSCALVAEAQDSFAVADHDAFHVIVAGVIEDPGNPVLIWIAEKKPSRLSPDFTKSLAALADGWGVDERQHLFHITNHQCVEQGLVRILQIA